MKKLTCIAVGTIVLAVLVFSLGALWPSGSVAASLADDQLLRALATMVLILGGGLLTHLYLLPGSLSIRQQNLWAAFQLLLAVALLAALTTAVAGFPERWMQTPAPAIGVITPLLFLLAVYFAPIVRRLHKAPREQAVEPAQLHEWGKAAALLIMLLALFAYALRWNEGRKQLEIDWKEVPAILIVFVLAELGVALVVIAKDVDSSVRAAKAETNELVTNSKKTLEAATAAMALAREQLSRAETVLKGVEQTATNTITEATRNSLTALADASTRLSEAKGSVVDTLDELRPVVSRLTLLARTDLWRDSRRIADLMVVDEEGFWKNLEVFTGSWLPREGATVDRHSGALIGDLFSVFVGRDVENGSVRQTAHGVSCITADAVFAEASEKWLTVMRGATSENTRRHLVIWAVTRLLPTEFAVPSGYCSGADSARRSAALQQFTGAVLKSCASTRESVGEYRRITLLQGESEFRAIVPPDVVAMECTLPNWLIWDARALGADGEVRDFDFIRRSCQSLLKSAGHEVDIHAKATIESLRSVFQVGLGGAGSGKSEFERKAGLLPYFCPADRLKCFHAFEIDLAGGNRAGVLGASAAHLDANVARGCLQDWRREFDLDKTSVGGIHGVDNGTVTLRQVLLGLGWQSILDWYCHRMHRAPNGTGAWWALVRDTGTEENRRDAETFLKPFYLEWNGTRVQTFDLLLIGSRPVDGASEEPKWHGAAISNIGFERTECTVQLVTCKKRLDELGVAVNGLCWGFRPGRQSHSAIEQYGKWIDLPDFARPVAERAATSE